MIAVAFYCLTEKDMRILLSPLWLLMLLSTTVLAPPSVRGADIAAEEIDGIVKVSLKTWEVPGAALLIVRDDRVLYLNGYGVRDIESGKLVTPDTSIIWASRSTGRCRSSPRLRAYPTMGIPSQRKE